MASYLCVKMNSSATKSYNIKSSANKPYLRVDTGFIPLTTATATGPKVMVRAGGVNYRLADFITTTTAITTGTSYLTSAKTTGTSYQTGSRSSTSGTGYETRASTSATTYYTRSSTSATTYYTRVSTSATSTKTRASTSATTYYTRSSTSASGYKYTTSTSSSTRNSYARQYPLYDVATLAFASYEDRYTSNTSSSRMTFNYRGTNYSVKYTTYSRNGKSGTGAVRIPVENTTVNYGWITYSSYYGVRFAVRSITNTRYSDSVIFSTTSVPYYDQVMAFCIAVDKNVANSILYNTYSDWSNNSSWSESHTHGWRFSINQNFTFSDVVTYRGTDGATRSLYPTSTGYTNYNYYLSSASYIAGTSYATRKSTSTTSYLTRASTSATIYYTRASTSTTSYLTRQSTSVTSYFTRSSTSNTTYATRSSQYTSNTVYLTQSETYETSYLTTSAETTIEG